MSKNKKAKKRKKKKSNYEILSEIRNTWFINPVTKIVDKNKKDKKNLRKETKEIIKNALEDI
jgi:hypothetical protein